MRVPVIDLFAGPGGLSEGFEQFDSDRRIGFSCVLSIEKDRSAYETLLLRAFLRQFRRRPDAYYRYLRGEISLAQLYDEFPDQRRRAAMRAIRLTLGPRNRERVDDLIRKALGAKNDKWVLIGGPPCQAYSVVGRARRRGEDRARFENDRRHFLYKEYLRIVERFRPPVFVMENVKGLLSSSAKGVEIFGRILDDFASVGYVVHSFVRHGNGREPLPMDYVIEAERFGIPQTRHRVILLGVRIDVERGSSVLRRAKRPVPIGAVIGDLPRIRSRVSPRSRDSGIVWEQELRRLSSAFCRDGRLRGRNGERRKIGALSPGGAFVRSKYPNPRRSRWLRTNDSWFVDRRIGGVTLHEARYHMPMDLRRYLFAAQHGRAHGVAPKIDDFAQWQRPAHRNIKRGGDTPFADRFRVQIRNKPCTTVVSHISKDGHYYIHYDPTQCRSLTVREAARVQTFPDNYYFVGSRTKQYEQIGNAVPPLLARQLARVVAGIIRKLPVSAKATR